MFYQYRNYLYLLFGNFDMIKMISCLPCKDSYERFEITVDGNNEDERSYIKNL